MSLLFLKNRPHTLIATLVFYIQKFRIHTGNSEREIVTLFYFHKMYVIKQSMELSDSVQIATRFQIEVACMK